MSWGPASDNQRGLAWFPRRRVGVRLNADTAVGIRFPGRTTASIDAVGLYLANVVGTPTVRAQLFRVMDLPQPKTTTVMRPTAQPVVENPGASLTGSPINNVIAPATQYQNIDEPDPAVLSDYVAWTNGVGGDFLHLRVGSGAFAAARITSVRLKVWVSRSGAGNGGDLRAAFRKSGDAKILQVGAQAVQLPVGGAQLQTFEWTTCPWTGLPWTQADVRALADTTGTYNVTLTSYSSSTSVVAYQAWLEADGYPAPLMESADVTVTADGWALLDVDTPTPAELLAVPQLTATAQFTTVAGSRVATVATVPAAATWEGAGVRPVSSTSPFYPGTVIERVLSTTSVLLSRPARTTGGATTIVMPELLLLVRRTSAAGSLTMFGLESDSPSPHNVYGHVLDLDQYGIATSLGAKLNRSFPFHLLSAQALSDNNAMEESQPYAGLTLEPVYAGRVVSQEFTLFTAVSGVQWLRALLARQASVCDGPLTVTARRKTLDVLAGAGDFEAATTSGWTPSNASLSAPGGSGAPLGTVANPNLLDPTNAEFEGGSPGQWEAEANAAAVSVLTPSGGSLQGTRALRLQSVAAGDVVYRWPAAGNVAGSAPMVLPGMTFSARASFRPSVAGTARTVRAELRYWSAANVLLATFTGAAVEDNAAVAWVEAVASGPAPAGAAYATMALRVVAAAGAAEQHQADQLGIFVGNPAAYSSPAGTSGRFMQMQATAAGSMFATYTSSAVLAGITYDVRAWFQPSAATGHDARLTVRWRDAGNFTIGAPVTVDPVLDAAGNRWSPAYLFGLVAPAGTASVQIEARWGVAANPGAGQVDYVDGVALIEAASGATVTFDPDDLERTPSLLTEVAGLFSGPLTFARSGQYVLDFASSATAGLGWLVPLLDSLGGPNRPGFNYENYPSEGQILGETDAGIVAGVRNANQDAPFVLGTVPAQVAGVAAVAEDVA